MGKKNVFIAGILLLALLPVIIAADFTPQGDINLRGTYAIENATNISAEYYCNNTGSCVKINEFVTGIESDLNVNSSNYAENWTTDAGNLNTINESQMENSGGTLSILVSWIVGLFYEKDEVYNKSETYTKSEVDNNFTYYILSSEEGNLNVNSSLSLNTSSGYIKDVNSTHFSLIDYILSIDQTWLTTFINGFLEIIRAEINSNVTVTNNNINLNSTADQVFASNNINLNASDVRSDINSNTTAINNNINLNSSEDRIFTSLNINANASDIRADINTNVTATNDNIVSNNTNAKIYANTNLLGNDSLRILSSEEGNLNVNNSDNWDSMDSINGTQMEVSDSDLNIKESWLTTFWNAILGTKTTDDLSEGSTNKYDNQSWNESRGNAIYIVQSDEGNLNVNYSDSSNSTIWWATVSGYVSKWFYKSGNDLAFNETELNNSIDDRLISTYYNATQSTIVAGTINGGTLVDTQHPDGNYDGVSLNFSEASGSPGLDLRVNFTNIPDFSRGVMRYKTSALVGDYPIRQLWNYDASAWDNYPLLAYSEDFTIVTQPIFTGSKYISNEVIQLRIYKSSNGNTNNHYYIDWVAMVEGPGVPSGQEVDPYSIHTDAINETQMNYTSGELIIKESWLTTFINTILVAYIPTSEEGNLNVNGSDYWDNYASVNATQIENSGGELNIKQSWLSTLFDALFGAKSTDDLSEGSTNKYDNQSWNESRGNELYIYTNGSAISLVGNQFNLTTCADNQVWKMNGAVWNCEADDAGAGAYEFNITGDTGTQQTIDTTNVVSILGGTNGIDTVVGATDKITINFDGSEVSNDTIPEAGIDFDTACAAGNHYYLNGNNLACEADDDTTYTAGSNISFDGTKIDLDGVSLRVWLDNVYKKIVDAFDGVYASLTGKPTHISNFTDDILWTTDFNASFDTRDSDTTYSAGNGISLSTTTFSVAGGTALTQDASGLSVTADAIGDTQLAFDTGQELTTTSKPTFGGVAIDQFNISITNITCFNSPSCTWYMNATDSCMYWPSGGKDCGAA